MDGILRINKVFFLNFMWILSACMSVHQGGQKRVLGPLGLELKQLWANIWVLGLNLGPSEDQPVLLIAELFLYFIKYGLKWPTK